MTWAKRLKRVFSVETGKYSKRVGKIKAIASVKDPEVIEEFLKNLGYDEASQTRNRSQPRSFF